MKCKICEEKDDVKKQHGLCSECWYDQASEIETISRDEIKELRNNAAYSNTGYPCHVCNRGIMKERDTSNGILSYCESCGFEGG